MFSNWFTKKQPIQPIQPPILMPPPKTFRDMTCGEIDKAIEQMDGKIDTITLGKRLKPMWLEDAEKAIQRERNAFQEREYKQRKGGKRKTRKIRHRFTQNRK
jgi:hypothetical protein